MSNITAFDNRISGMNNHCNVIGTLLECLIIPPVVNSIEGVWAYIIGAPRIFVASLQALEFQIIIVLATTHVVNLVVIKNIGTIPIFASQLIAGLLLGSTVFGQINSVHSLIFPNKESLPIYDVMGSFGLLFFLFLVGVKTNPAYALAYGKRAITIAISITILPTMFAMCFSSYSTNDVHLIFARRSVAGAQSVTALAVISHLLIELKISNTEIGRLALASALAAHTIDIAIITLAAPTPDRISWWVLVLGTVVFLASNFFVLRPLLQWMIRRTPEGQALEEWVIFTTILLTFAFSIFVATTGHIATLGAFIFGLAVPEGPPLGSALEEKFEPLITGIFLPLFSASITMRVSPRSILEDLVEVEFAIKTILAIFLFKLAVCFIVSSLFLRMHWKESLTFSLIMCSKGIVETSIYVFFFDAKIISEGSYAIGVLSILLNSTILPIAIQSLYNSIYMGNVGYEKGNIMDLTHDSELKILACVHDSDEIAPLISLLNASGYSHECRVAVYVLHLRELIGSSTPLFIAHQSYEKRLIGSSYEDVILAFNQLEQKSLGSMTVNAFTAISPPNTMYMDICTLACEHRTTLIILPFHRKWYNGGLVDSDSSVIRNMNRAVLDNAFCTVGILVHHPTGNETLAKLLSVTSFNVCMMFFGGNDDREALAFVLRMAKDPKVSLTIIHFSVKNHQTIDPMNWDTILDVEQLKEVKNNGEDGNVHYKEEFVKDGPETAKRILKLVNNYDLIVVGRQYRMECAQTSSLSEWTEFPELGIIGDFLASTDVKCNASVLIVQQQNNYQDNRELDHDHQVHEPWRLTSMIKS